MQILILVYKVSSLGWKFEHLDSWSDQKANLAIVGLESRAHVWYNIGCI